jgi:hypothetical protein
MLLSSDELPLDVGRLYEFVWVLNLDFDIFLSICCGA